MIRPINHVWIFMIFRIGAISLGCLLLNLNGITALGLSAVQNQSCTVNNTSDNSRPSDTSDAIGNQMQRARKAAEIVRRLAEAEGREIPSELIQGSQAIAVVPNAMRDEVGAGDLWGKGLMSVHESRRWRPPVYIDLSGGRPGSKIGSTTDLVFVFSDIATVQKLLSSELNMGNDVAVVAGPIGRNASAQAAIKSNVAVYSYCSSKGSFAGFALNGAVLALDDSANKMVYGSEIRGQEILQGVLPIPEITLDFFAALGQIRRHAGN